MYVVRRRTVFVRCSKIDCVVLKAEGRGYDFVIVLLRTNFYQNRGNAFSYSSGDQAFCTSEGNTFFGELCCSQGEGRTVSVFQRTKPFAQQAKRESIRCRNPLAQYETAVFSLLVVQKAWSPQKIQNTQNRIAFALRATQYARK